MVLTRSERGNHEPRKISCSQFLAQHINSTTLPKNVRLTEWVKLKFFESTVKPISCTIILRSTDFSRLNGSC